MDGERIRKRIAGIAAELAELMAEPYDALTTAEQLALAAQWETVTRSQAVIGHRLVAELATAPVAELGETNAATALATLLRISKSEAGRRIHEARDLAPRQALTGEVLEPMLPCTAAAQERGQIGGEHVTIIRGFFKRLPSFVDPETRVLAEAQLAEIACGVKPEELRQAAGRLAMLLDQDGELTDADRARRRYLSIGKQQSDGMSEVRGRLDPEGRAVMDVVLAKLAAPGMCNPDDESPCLDGDPSTDAKHADCRSQGQRNHDALKALGRALLAPGRLGSHNGLPVTMMVVIFIHC